MIEVKSIIRANWIVLKKELREMGFEVVPVLPDGLERAKGLEKIFQQTGNDWDLDCIFVLALANGLEVLGERYGRYKKETGASESTSWETVSRQSIGREENSTE